MNQQELQQKYNQVKNNIEASFNQGEISEERKNQLFQQLENEKAEFMGEGMEEGEGNSQMEEELSEITKQQVLKNRFGAALLELGVMSDYDSIDTLVADLAENTQNDEEDVANVLTGDNIPDEDFVIAMVEHFGLDEEDAEDLYQAAIESWKEVSEQMDFNEQSSENQKANFNNSELLNQNYQQQDNQGNIQQELQQLKEQNAKFEAEKNLKEGLNQRINQAENLVQSGDMPPVVREWMLGNFQQANDEQLAYFSQTAEANNVSLESELHAIDKVLSVFSQLELGKNALFGAIADQQVEDEEAKFEKQQEKQVEEIARNNIEMRKNR